MNPSQLKMITHAFSMNIISLTKRVPRNTISEVILRQIVKSGTSVGANYRAACLARSRADFIAKLKIVEEETDETLYWLDLLTSNQFISKDLSSNLINQGNEIFAIIKASIHTAKGLKK